jgi:hypothetical protein
VLIAKESGASGHARFYYWIQLVRGYFPVLAGNDFPFFVIRPGTQPTMIPRMKAPSRIRARDACVPQKRNFTCTTSEF